MEATKKQNLSLVQVDEFEALSGHGVKAQVSEFLLGQVFFTHL
ncbi:hypothetical protein [Coxiella-like endosymbiont]|nr:hypothetical protein [Coxiella-like endosymbiont]